MAETLTRLLDMLANGHELQDAELGAFSDLDRSSAATVRQHWSGLDVPTRALLLERAGELADVNLDLNFEALGQLALDDPDPEVRERAVTTLWESTDRSIAERLAGLALNDPGPGVRAAAALGLQPFVESLVMNRVPSETSERIVSALKHALSDGDVGVQAAALEAAGALPEDWVSERTLEAYESNERDLKIAALRAMGASALDRWIEYIEDQLYSGDVGIRLEATLAAGSLGSELLVEPMSELLSDDDPEIVMAAVVALGEIGGEDAIELLEAFKPEAPEGFDAAVDDALEMASGGGFRRFGELLSKDDEDDEGYEE